MGKNTQLIKIGASLCLAIWLLVRLMEKGGLQLGPEFDSANKLLLLISTSLFGVGVLLSALRWGLLLRVQTVHIGFFNLLRLTMIGNFFNLVLPGGVGGDVVKMVEVRKHAGDHVTEAAFTILIDRVIGLLGLLLLAVISAGFCWDFLYYAPAHIRGTVWGVAIVSVCGFAGVGLGFAHRQLRRLPGAAALTRLFKAKMPGLAHTVARVLAALDLYRNQLPTVLATLVLSMIIQSAVGIGVMLLGWSVHTDKLGWQHYFLATQMGNTVSAVPVTPGGLGARDTVIQTFLEAAGAVKHKSAVIPLFLSLIIVFWSLVGGLFYAIEPSAEHKEQEEALEHYLEKGETELDEIDVPGDSERQLESPAHA